MAKPTDAEIVDALREKAQLLEDKVIDISRNPTYDPHSREIINESLRQDILHLFFAATLFIDNPKWTRNAEYTKNIATQNMKVLKNFNPK